MDGWMVGITSARARRYFLLSRTILESHAWTFVSVDPLHASSNIATTASRDGGGAAEAPQRPRMPTPPETRVAIEGGLFVTPVRYPGASPQLSVSVGCALGNL